MIFITGHHCTGKTTIARRLTDLGYLHLETSGALRNFHRDVAPGINFDKWAGETAELHDFIILDELVRIYREGRKGDEFRGVVITGNRQVSGIKFLKENFPYYDGEKSVVVYLKARDEVLMERQMQSNRPGRWPCDEDLFLAYLRADREMGVEKIENEAEIVVDSNGSVEETLKEMDCGLRMRGFWLPEGGICLPRERQRDGQGWETLSGYGSLSKEF